MANKKVRILVAGAIGGVQYHCDDVVNLPDALVKQHAAQVDAHKDAVSYALSVNGGTVIDHVDPIAEQKAALEAHIAQLEAELAAADEGAKPAIQQSIAAARQQLADLG